MNWVNLILGGYKVWTTIKPFQKWKDRRQAKRLAKGISTTTTEDGNMDIIKQQILASLLKIVGSSMVTWGFIDPSQLTSANAAIVQIGGGVLTLVGLYLAHKKQKASAPVAK